MTDCRVFRRATGSMWIGADGRQPRLGRTWVGICECGETVRPSTYGPYGMTRKTVRDALYRHRQQKSCRPGLEP